MSAVRDTARMEVIRLTSVRSTYLLSSTAVLLGTVTGLLIVIVAPQGPLSGPVTSAALSAGGDAMPLSLVGTFVAVLAVATVGHDYRFGLLPTVLTVQPRREVVVVARLVVLAVAAVAVALAVEVLALVLCLIVGRPPAHDPTTWRVAASQVLVTVLFAWLGAGLAWVMRSAAGAVSVLLLVPLLVEPLITWAALEANEPALRAAVHWLPFDAARQAVGRQLGSGGEGIGALAATGVFGGVTLAVLALAVTLVGRRDA